MSFRQDFHALKAIGADPAGGWSRLAFSNADNAAHEWLLARGRAAGLSARQDGMGNVILRLDGVGRAIMIGSHLDTVQNGGAFDGAIGVLAGLEVARRLAALDRPGAPVEVVAFRDEEGRFGPFTGSRAMAGTHDEAALQRARSPEGVALTDAAANAGAVAGNAPRDWDHVQAYLELHIEQGRVLETAGIPLGIVTAIAGQERLSLRFTGQADHAGTTPMALRRDALIGATRFADAFYRLIAEAEDPELRGTIGYVRMLPNQGNVVPEQVTLGLEIRSAGNADLPAWRDRLGALAETIAVEAGLKLRVRRIYSDAAVPMDDRLRARLTAAAERLGHDVMDIMSGANHDAGIIGRIIPAAMLFVPSKEGRSHCPEEETEIDHIEAAIDVLFETVQKLREV